RTSDRRGRIAGLTLAAIREADAGSWFRRDFAEERVPTLEEALACCAELGLGANIEIKAERGRDAATVGVSAASLARRRGRPPPMQSWSFLPAGLTAAQLLLPEVPRGFLFRQLPARWQALAARLGAATIHCDQRHLTAPLVGAVRAAGYPLLAYTVNDPQRA